MSAIGVVIGLGISASLSRLLTTFLFGLTATDAVTFVAGASILAVAAITASYLPARRAARVDATVALRQQSGLAHRERAAS